MIDNAENQRKKIVLVTDRCWPAVGGVEQWVHAVSALLPARFDVSIVALANNSRNAGFLRTTIFAAGFASYADEAGHAVEALTPPLWGRLAMLPLLLWYAPLVRRLMPHLMFDFLYWFYRSAYFRALDALLRNADIVHCFSTGYLAACVTEVCTRRKIPLVHAPSIHFDKWGDSVLLLAAYAQADILISQTGHAKAEFLKRLPSPAPQIRISTPPLLPEPQGKQPVVPFSAPFVLFLGRREEHKGLSLLLSAFGRLTSHAALVVAGPGPALEGRAASVVDLGPVDDSVKQWLLANCAVFCLPSLDESFGIVYLEAMRCAKPVVALEVTPANEIIVSNETGILVRPGDPDGLVRALDSLLADAALRGRMGANGKLRYEENYSADKIIGGLAEMYDTLSAIRRPQGIDA
jgi:glycosyltransferase involved in cell wall biosynthesis